MIKTYKPSPIKPVISEMWAPVSLTDWKLEGDSFIETQFDYVAKLNAQIDRSVPGMVTDSKQNKAFLNYQIIPSIAWYGKVAVNPAGSLLVMDGTSIKGNTALTETNITGYNAIASLINQQRTDLDLTRNIKNSKDTNYPIIPIYMRAMMYNTQALVKPALHLKSMFGYLESLKNVSNRAAIRITQIMNKFKQNKFVKPYNEYLELLDVTPIHTDTANSMIDFFTIEKLNDAFNTSYDYVIVDSTVDHYHTNDFDIKSVFEVQKWDDSGKNKVGAPVNLLLVNSAESKFAERDYLKYLYMAVNASDADFNTILKEYIDGRLITDAIEMINKTISMIASLPTLFQPFYAAVPFLSEYIDTSIFGTKKFTNLEMGIRKSSFYSKGNVMTQLKPVPNSADSIYPTWSMEVPLYNGALSPSAPFNTNGILYFLSDNLSFTTATTAAERKKQLALSTYIPFVDISKMVLSKAIIASNKLMDYSKIIADTHHQEVTLIPNTTTTAKSFFLRFAEIDFDNEAGAIKLPVIDTYFDDLSGYNDVYRKHLPALIQWITFKSDHAIVETKNKNVKNIVFASPNITGFRQIEITPVADIVRRATPKLLGMKKVGF